MIGSVSNFRIVKGTAVYTSSFRVPTEPLTNITNTKLLCCQSSTVTTATTGTVTSGGDPTASTNSPFDDPEGFQFGEEGDQNIIKCGSYEGVAGSPVNFDVEIGWEPQFFMVKNVGLSGANNEWLMWDSMRGVAAQIHTNDGGNDARLSPTESAGEYNGDDQIEFHPTGVRVTTPDGRVNGGSGARLVYIAIRRPDGYVGKPAEVGTDVFNIDFGNGSSTGPALDANFAVDALIKRAYASTSDCGIHFRLTGPRDLRTNTNDIEGNAVNPGKFDYMNGVSINQSTSIWGLMWKRHAGLDVVTYTGNNSTKVVNHSLGRVPEMIWIKARNDAQNWLAYHKGLNGGTTPWNYHIMLNSDAAEGAYSFINQPTTTDFTVTSGWQANGKNYAAMLFASVDGISKCGYYTGDGSSSMNIECGFTPRFVIMKRINTTGNWVTYDTTRGWSGDNSGADADKMLKLDTNGAQVDYAWGSGPYSTGFNTATWIAATDKVVYYAHA